jgi:hypothetical protein
MARLAALFLRGRMSGGATMPADALSARVGSGLPGGGGLGSEASAVVSESGTALPRPAVPLTDQQNVDSELGPDDVQGTGQYTPTTDEQALIDLVTRRYQESADHRKSHEGRWLEGLAFYNGDQWSDWDSRSGSFKSLKHPLKRDRIYNTRNKIKPRINKRIARMLSARVDASVSPKTGMKSDILGTREARGVLTDIDQRLDFPGQLLEMLTGIHIIGPHYLKTWFDPYEVVPIPVFDVDPQTGKLVHKETVDAPAGAICQEILSPFEVYRDPKARTLGKSAWVIQGGLRDLEYIKSKFPKTGRYVRGEGQSPGDVGRVETLLNARTSDNNKHAGKSGQHQAVYLEMWEKPTRAYPEGRYVCVANGVLLYSGPWPYKRLLKLQNPYPFSELVYEPGLLSAYGDNAITPVKDAQRSLNRAVSRLDEWFKTGFGKMLVPYGCEIKPDAFKSAEPNEVITYNPDGVNGLNHKPELWPTPELGPETMAAIELANADINDQLNVNDVTNGVAPAGITAAAALQQLADQDRSDAAILQILIQTWAKHRAEVILAIAAECYQEPRLLAVRDTDPTDSGSDTGEDPNAPAVRQRMHLAMRTALSQAGATPDMLPELMAGQGGKPGEGEEGGAPGLEGVQPSDPGDRPASQAYTFQHLSEGRYVVSATISSPKTPAARVQQILDMAGKGMFAPEALPVTIFLLKQMDIEQSDKLTSDLLQSLTTLIQMRQAEAQAKQAQGGPPPPDPREVIALQSQARVQETQAKAQVDTESKAQLADQAHGNKMQEIALTQALTAAAAENKLQADADLLEAEANRDDERAKAEREHQAALATQQATTQKDIAAQKAAQPKSSGGSSSGKSGQKRP